MINTSHFETNFDPCLRVVEVPITKNRPSTAYWEVFVDTHFPYSAHLNFHRFTFPADPELVWHQTHPRHILREVWSNDLSGAVVNIPYFQGTQVHHLLKALVLRLVLFQNIEVSVQRLSLLHQIVVGFLIPRGGNILCAFKRLVLCKIQKIFILKCLAFLAEFELIHKRNSSFLNTYL